MPQFDFYSWYSVCFWTLLFFHLSYFFFLKFVFLPLMELAKVRQKLVNLILTSGRAPALLEVSLVTV